MIVTSASPVRPWRPLLRGMAAAFLAIVILAATTGCRRSQPDPRRVPVTGVILSEGKPLERGSVLFAAAEGRDAGAAPLREGGMFATTLLPGEYKVAVRSFAAGEPNAEGVYDGPKKSLIPTKYGDTKTSGLTVTAARGMEPIRLELGR